MFFRIISILLMQKQIPLCLLAIVLSVSLFGQNLKADKIILPDSDLTNLYQIDSGVYRSEQPSKEGFKALEKYGIGEALNLRNRHSDDDEAAGTNVKLHRVKTKAHSINEEQLISFTYAPKDADASNLLLELSDGTLAKAEQTDDGIVLHTQAKEGTFTLVAKKGSAKSNELTFQVIDKEKAEQERIAAEKKAEEERIAAEKKAEEERLAAEKAEQERIAARQQSQAQSQNSATVYVTPTGKKYHYNSSCNGGSYSPTTLDNAIKMGLTPCKKCVG